MHWKELCYGINYWVLYKVSGNFGDLLYFYAMQMNAKVVFSRLIQTYKFSLPEDYELVIIQKGALQPKDDVHCVLENRKMHVDSNSEIDSLL